jgi:amidase
LAKVLFTASSADAWSGPRETTMAWDGDLASLDALAQAELVRRGKVSARELVDAAIARIDRANPHVNAVILPMYERARAEAALPRREGPLAGVPFLLKDFLAEYAGVRFTEGSAYLHDFVSDHDTELAVGPTTEPT